MKTYVRFEYGSEDRMSEDLGPFSFVQVTYDSLEAAKDDDTSVELAFYYDGIWHHDGEAYSDIVIFGH